MAAAISPLSLSFLIVDRGFTEGRGLVDGEEVLAALVLGLGDGDGGGGEGVEGALHAHRRLRPRRRQVHRRQRCTTFHRYRPLVDGIGWMGKREALSPNITDSSPSEGIRAPARANDTVWLAGFGCRALANEK